MLQVLAQPTLVSLDIMLQKHFEVESLTSIISSHGADNLQHTKHTLDKHPTSASTLLTV